jgi:hypothetical protein
MALVSPLRTPTRLRVINLSQLEVSTKSRLSPPPVNHLESLGAPSWAGRSLLAALTQTDYDIQTAKRQMGKELAKIEPIATKAA